MPTVPSITQRAVLEKRGPTALADPNVPAGAFGATQGRAIARLGDQVVGISDDIFKATIAIQDEDDKREFGKLDTELASFITTVGRGDGTPENQGFYATRGENTLLAFPTAQRAIQAKRKELLAAASNNRVRNMLSISSQQRVDKELSSYLSQVGKQRKLANEAVGKARIDQATDDAVAAFVDRAVLERALVIAEQEVAILFKDFPQEVIDNEVEKAVTGILDKVITAASRQDNRLARKLFEDFESRVDGVSRAAISIRLDARDRQLLQDKIRAETAAEKAHKKRQTEFFEQMIIGISKEEVSEDLIFSMLAKDNINAAQQAKLLKLVREDDVITDETEKLALKIKTLKGESSFDEIAEANEISAKDKQELVSIQDQVGKSGGILATREVKDLMKTIDERIGGVRGPLAILVPTHLSGRLNKSS